MVSDSGAIANLMTHCVYAKLYIVVTKLSPIYGEKYMEPSPI